MTILSEYLRKKEELESVKQELDRLNNESEMQAEFKFMAAIKSLMDDYGVDCSHTLSVLADIDPAVVGKRAGAKNDRAARKLQVWRNPETGEVVKSRGGNTVILRQWRESYGRDTVASWKEA